ncbi:ABC transporter permease [Streptomyces sp. NPDC048342]|uniref:ABC transporter permease n=1 Tax=unclassified Streptomyces TaxID=2593676 RepID=UPI00343952DD
MSDLTRRSDSVLAAGADQEPAAGHDPAPGQEPADGRRTAPDPDTTPVPDATTTTTGTTPDPNATTDPDATTTTTGTTTDPDTTTPDRGRMPWPAAAAASRYALVVVWALMALVCYILMPHRFGSTATISSIFGSQQVLVFLAMSAMITLVVGEFDLSIASVMGIAATLIPVLVTSHGWNVWAACLFALLVCLAAGAVNAFFVVIIGVPSFVVTLGMGTLLMGAAQAVSGSTIVSVASPSLSGFALHEVLGMPVSFYYGILLAALLAYLLGWTPLGRGMVFVGASPEVARLAGIPVRRIRIGAYLAGALVAGLAGVMLVATVGGFDSSSSATYLLPALAAVFLGTAVVQPGMFNPVGTMIAIYFLTTGIFGLQLLGFSGWIQNVFYGAGLVVAVTLAKVVRDRTTE